MKYIPIISAYLSIILNLTNPSHHSSINGTLPEQQIDSVYVIELITQRLISKIPCKGSDLVYKAEIDSATVAKILVKGKEQSYLTILSPNKNIHIQLSADSIPYTDSLGDSLLNYLWKSNNQFVGQNSKTIFTSQQPDAIIKIFDAFKLDRARIINSFSDRLSKTEKDILLYQNDARIHSFLFYYGKVINHLSAEHPFYDFVKKMDNNTKWAKTLPQTLINKHEMEYKVKYGRLKSIDSFIDYISTQTQNQDLLHFLKAIYLNEIITSPSYWEEHQDLFDIEVIKNVLEKEKENPYYELIQESTDSFFSSQKGVKAYDFTAERLDGSKVKLSDLKGKIVFIDSWASWCGPCIKHRPKVLEMAKKYQNDPLVEVLMISVDSNKESWKKILSRRDELNQPNDLIILDGMNSKYGESFNIRAIPKYMLIDQTGTIVDADISEPSLNTYEMIESLKKK